MKTKEIDNFSLENFEGPLEFLLRLIQKSEIEIYDVPIQVITEQFLQRIAAISSIDIEQGADFVGTAATLIWLKSRMLLPKHEQIVEELEDDPTMEILQHLVTYCKFKDIAKILVQREEEQNSFYYRGVQLPTGDTEQPGLGIDHLALSDLHEILQKALQRAASRTRTINEEPWRVSDKIASIRQIVRTHQVVAVAQFFTPQHSHLEMIVSFLAILELMKLNEIRVTLNDQNQLILQPQKPEESI